LCPATINTSIMAANMWKNSLKNVESDNNKILYETILEFFYSETVLTFWVSLVIIHNLFCLYAPAAWPPGKTQYQLNRRLCGPQSQSGRMWKISPPPRFDSRTTQPVASRYTDWAIPARILVVQPSDCSLLKERLSVQLSVMNVRGSTTELHDELCGLNFIFCYAIRTIQISEDNIDTVSPIDSQVISW